MIPGLERLRQKDGELEINLGHTEFQVRLSHRKRPGLGGKKREREKKKKGRKGAGEMAQWLRALSTLPEVLSSIPSNHMVAHNHL